MNDDPIINEIHKYREEHAAQFNFDIKKIVDFYKEEQKNSNKKIVNFINKLDKYILKE